MTREQIIKSRKFSPGIVGGDILTFMECGKKDMFWFKHKDSDKFHKDEKGKYSEISLDNVVDARLLYLASFENEEKDALINKEMDSHKKELKEKAQKVISIIKGHESVLGEINTDDISGILFNALPYKDKQRYRDTAEIFFDANPKAKELKYLLIESISKEDYDTLYHLVEFEFGKPTASFSTTGDITALIKTFGADNINQTLDKTKELGSIYLIAKAKVEKSYYPS